MAVPLLPLPSTISAINYEMLYTLITVSIGIAVISLVFFILNLAKKNVKNSIKTFIILLLSILTILMLYKEIDKAEADIMKNDEIPIVSHIG